jgi:pimeloyl-ACP methyl ester carboxylesterase
VGDCGAARRGPVRSEGLGVAWRTKPSAYVVATQDHSVHPDLHRFSAKRMGATTYEVESSHCPMLSHPDVVLDAIRNLATSLQGALATAA